MANILILADSTSHASSTNTRNALQNKGHTVTVAAASAYASQDYGLYDIVLLVRIAQAGSYTSGLVSNIRSLLDGGKPVGIGLTDGGVASNDTDVAIVANQVGLTGLGFMSNGAAVNEIEITDNTAGYPTDAFSLGNLQIYTANNFDMVVSSMVGTVLAVSTADHSLGDVGLPSLGIVESGTSYNGGANTTGARCFLYSALYAGQSGYTANGSTLLDNLVTWATTADTGIIGSGDLSAGASDTSGTGASGSTGTGAPAAGDATASGAGASGSTGTGDLSAGQSAVAGTGNVGFQEITGTGALQAGESAVAGNGVSGSTGTGSPASQDATAAGVGISGSTGAGDLSAQAATVKGDGTSGSTGSGALQANDATVHGTASNIISGSGALQAGDADAAGAGVTGSAGSGDLAAGAAAAGGAGKTGSTGQGALIIDFAAVAGLGRSGSVGSGDLLAGNAVIVGFDVPAVTFGSVSVTLSVVTAVSVSARLATGITAEVHEVTGLEATESAA